MQYRLRHVSLLELDRNAFLRVAPHERLKARKAGFKLPNRLEQFQRIDGTARQFGKRVNLLSDGFGGALSNLMLSRRDCSCKLFVLAHDHLRPSIRVKARRRRNERNGSAVELGLECLRKRANPVVTGGVGQPFRVPGKIAQALGGGAGRSTHA